jgi:hypothetical protein
MLRSVAIAIILILPGIAQVSPPNAGSVEGLVLDGDGKSLADATVFVGTLANGPRTKTDPDGRFRLSGLPVGSVGLQAFKESDGYPYNMFSFFLVPGEQLLKVDVAAGETLRNVVIHLGAKAAYLKLHVTDEAGVPVNAGLSFSRPDLGQYGDYERSATANDVILVPPVPFRLTVEEKGFQPWHYGGERWQNQEGLINLKSGESKILNIKLKNMK